MRKLFLSFAITICLNFLVSAQNRAWNRPMQLQTCNISVNANYFTATTFMELEFFNPNNQEIEGLQLFELMPHQVITGFQLMLNDKYRDASIEEKWKATNTYNTIVGKRVDPAILKREYGNNYSIHIYPIPPKGTRKVTITIQEILPAEKNQLHYNLPFKVADTCRQFSLQIKAIVKDNAVLKCSGLIAEQVFSTGATNRRLQWDAKQVILKKTVAFSISLPGNTQTICTNKDTHKFFTVRHHSLQPAVYPVRPASLSVYWDVSGSADKRDVKKEIRFLEQFIAYHKIKQLTIMPFNYKIQGESVFELNQQTASNWKAYLKQLGYEGATQLGCIDLTKDRSDMVMLFSDGHNTYGKRKPIVGNALVYAINSSMDKQINALEHVAGSTGGKVIDIATGSIYDAIKATTTAENWLLNIVSASGRAVVEQSFPMRFSETFSVNGTAENSSDTLYLNFGSANEIRYTDTVFLNTENCVDESVERINMLSSYAAINGQHNWESALEFGLKQKVVTKNTAFLVLEKATDYVKYNIAPPKDLEEECRQLNFVKRDTRWERKQWHMTDAFERLNNVVTAYNNENKKLNENAALITLKKETFDTHLYKVAGNAVDNTSAILSGQVMGLSISSTNALEEVVVTGYSTMRKANVTGSVTYVNNSQVMASSGSVEQALQGRVAGMAITNANGIPGSMPSVVIRGAGSLNGNNQPLYVLNGVPVSGNINQLVNTSEIDNIVVLKDAVSTAMYGSRGANGVIVVNTKKWRNYDNYYQYNRKYKLRDMEDVAYMVEWNDAAAGEKLMVYNKLVVAHEDEPGFYLDMADAFFKLGQKETAMKILMRAPESGNATLQVNIAMAFILESWGNFKEAAHIYEQLVADEPQQLTAHRNLAWAYYQQGLYQQAINTLYAALELNTGNLEKENLSLKTMILRDLNAIIGIHPTLKTGIIPTALIQPLSADLRIVLDGNERYMGKVQVKEPGRQIASQSGIATKNGGLVFKGTGYFYANAAVEYQLNKLKTGRYFISTNYYDYNAGTPQYIRVMTFRDFGKPSQQISIENVVMNNQYGEIEIANIDCGKEKK